MKILKNKRAVSVILLILITGICFLVFSKEIDLSDGMGFRRGQADGQMYFGLAKLHFRNRYLIDSTYWMFLGIKTIVDSEINWNRAQPYIKQYNVLVGQDKFIEALNTCGKIDKLIRKYDWDAGILHDCYLLRQRLNQS
jgi:hypothetical protein